jgi:hypothetical protein
MLMVIFRPAFESENFAEIPRLLYLVRGVQERLAVVDTSARRMLGVTPEVALQTGRATGRASPWRPVGTLATLVFKAVRIQRRLRDQTTPGWEAAARLVSDVLEARSRGWGHDDFTPDRDVARLREALLLPTAAYAFPPEDVQRARFEAEFFVMARRQRRVRAGVIQRPTVGRWATWRGVAGDADVFETTPLGAAVLSALYGAARGELRACPDCWTFFTPPRTQWRRARCDDCRALSLSRSRKRGGLAVYKQERWRLIMDRMRKGGFARRRILGKKAQDEWRANALQELHRITTRDELDAWEHRIAPKARAGRPRKTPTR